MEFFGALDSRRKDCNRREQWALKALDALAVAERHILAAGGRFG
ncbi:hypothetical protein [Halosimplex sp. J119]